MQAVSHGTAAAKAGCTLKIKHCKKLKHNLSTSRKGLFERLETDGKDSF